MTVEEIIQMWVSGKQDTYYSKIKEDLREF